MTYSAVSFETYFSHFRFTQSGIRTWVRTTHVTQDGHHAQYTIHGNGVPALLGPTQWVTTKSGSPVAG